MSKKNNKTRTQMKSIPRTIRRKQKIPRNEMLQGISLGDRWDSNPRHSEPQSDALTN